MWSKLLSLIHKACYLLLHFVFTLQESTLKLANTHLKPRPRLPAATPQWRKTPTHITVLLGHEEPSLKDLANLIIWCMSAGISFISFYDHKGILKSREDELRRIASDPKHALGHVIWHGSSDKAVRNGFAGAKIHVKVLSHGDHGLSDFSKQLVGCDDGRRVRGLSVGDVDRGLRERYEFPDPDLGVCCGTFCLFGYPPWQCRVTEFFRISSHHGITLDEFFNLLCSYDRCEQRYGK